MRIATARGAIAAALLACAQTAVPATAADLPIGPSLTFPKSLTLEPGSYRLSPLRAADPDGGPPWGFATFRAKTPPRGGRQDVLLCNEYGRVVDGRLGVVTEENTFRPYTEGGSAAADCGGFDERHGDASGYATRATPAELGSKCSPSGLTTSGAPCAPRDVRTVIQASLGNGILGAEIRDYGSRTWKKLSVDNGQLFAVRAGYFTDRTHPEVRVRATVCGPDARTDIHGWRMVKRGCTITFPIPDGPRPAPESAASRRARVIKRLNLPVRVVKRPHQSSMNRYVARLSLPISVQAPNEGYAAEVRGPSGRGCKVRGWTNTRDEYLTSYLQVAGKTYDVPIIPIDQRRGVWCRGRYTVTVLFKRQTGTGSRAKTSRKVVAAGSFRVR